jgi:hypothetical protein
VQLNAVADLEAKTGNHAIDSIVVYRPTRETAMAHILYVGNGALYDIQLDGSGLRRIQMQPYCYLLEAIDTQGAHGLCGAEPGVQAFDLDEISSSWKTRLLVPTSHTSYEALISPTIAPDGQHFAALHRVDTGPAVAINIYALDRSMTAATLVATITLSGLDACHLVWSPDGRWLAITTDESTPSSVVGATYAFQLASILPTFPKQGSPPIQVALSNAHLTKLVDSPNQTTAWRPSEAGALWTYVEAGTIWQVDVVSGRRTAILAVPNDGLCALSWTPDGKQLVFVQCRRDELAQPPPARLYVYTPPAT